MFSICFLLYHVAPAKQLVWAGQVNVAVSMKENSHKKRGYVHDILTKITLRYLGITYNKYVRYVFL